MNLVKVPKSTRIGNVAESKIATILSSFALVNKISQDVAIDGDGNYIITEDNS